MEKKEKEELLKEVKALHEKQMKTKFTLTGEEFKEKVFNAIMHKKEKENLTPEEVFTLMVMWGDFTVAVLNEIVPSEISDELKKKLEQSINKKSDVNVN